MFYHNKNPILSIPCIFNLASKRSFGKNSYVLDKSIELLPTYPCHIIHFARTAMTLKVHLACCALLKS